MPAYTIPGLSTGQNTNDLVKRLVELEAKPIKRWERDIANNKAQTLAWNELKKLTINLQTKTKALVSYTAPFSSKKLQFSEEGFVAGDANRNAKQGKMEIEVVQLASRNKIAGAKVAKDVDLPAGKFSIISQSTRVDIDFPGGKIEMLREKIDAYAKKIAKPSVTKVDTENSVLSIQATKYGKEAELKFFDPDGILKKAGLVSDNVSETPPQVTPITFNGEGEAYQTSKFANNEKEDLKYTKNELGISLNSNTSFTFSIDKFKVDKYSSIEFTVKNEDNTELPGFLPIGVKYLEGETTKVKFEPVAFKEGKYTLKISEFAKGNEITHILLSNPSNGKITYAETKYIQPGNIQGAAPLNTIVPADDAIFKVDGIEISRESNENINDAIDGISFHLLKPTEGTISAEVDIDVSKGVNMLREFVVAYNELVKFSKDITTSNKEGKVVSDKADDSADISATYWDIKNKSGLLAGDSTVMRLITGLKTNAGASYPSSTDPRFKVASDLGITTGDPGSSWKEISEGLLVMNETQVQKALIDYPDSVKELFASDNNEDSKPDNGLGIAILEQLKPFTQFNSGIVASKIKVSEDSINESNKKIKNYESYLAGFEQKLKLKFQYMEQGVGRNKSVGNYLKNTFRQQNND